jgi:hypothetical protein
VGIKVMFTWLSDNQQIRDKHMKSTHYTIGIYDWYNSFTS